MAVDLHLQCRPVPLVPSVPPVLAVLAVNIEPPSVTTSTVGTIGFACTGSTGCKYRTLLQCRPVPLVPSVLPVPAVLAVNIDHLARDVTAVCKQCARA